MAQFLIPSGSRRISQLTQISEIPLASSSAMPIVLGDGSPVTNGSTFQISHTDFLNSTVFNRSNTFTELNTFTIEQRIINNGLVTDLTGDGIIIREDTVSGPPTYGFRISSSAEEILFQDIIPPSNGNIFDTFLEVKSNAGEIGILRNTSIDGNLIVSGGITTEILNVNVISSSIVYSSGSNIFGNTSSNTHQFTGSLRVTGSANIIGGFTQTVGAVSFGGAATFNNSAATFNAGISTTTSTTFQTATFSGPVNIGSQPQNEPRTLTHFGNYIHTGNTVQTGSISVNGNQNIIGDVNVTGSLIVSGSNTFRNIGRVEFTGSVNVNGGMQMNQSNLTFKLPIPSGGGFPDIDYSFKGQPNITWEGGETKFGKWRQYFNAAEHGWTLLYNSALDPHSTYPPTYSVRDSSSPLASSVAQMRFNIAEGSSHMNFWAVEFAPGQDGGEPTTPDWAWGPQLYFYQGAVGYGSTIGSSIGGALRIASSCGRESALFIESDSTCNPKTWAQRVETSTGNYKLQSLTPVNWNNLASNADGSTKLEIDFSSGQVIISGSLNVNENITASSFTGSLSYTNLDNIPNGIVSSSTQINEYNIFATTGSNTFIGNQIITGSVDISGSLEVNDDVKIENGYIILTEVSQSLDFANDVQAESGGVPLGGLYRNGNTIQIRIS
jgi:hypothetical protein